MVAALRARRCLSWLLGVVLGTLGPAHHVDALDRRLERLHVVRERRNDDGRLTGDPRLIDPELDASAPQPLRDVQHPRSVNAGVGNKEERSDRKRGQLT